MRSVLLTVVLIGCATEGDLGASAERVEALQAQVDALEATVEGLQAQQADHATQAWVAANYATGAEVDAAIAAALPEGAVATEEWVGSRYAEIGEAEAAVAEAVADGTLATQTWADDRFATPAEVGTTIGAAVTDGTLASQTWVTDTFATPDDVSDAIEAAVTDGDLATPADVTGAITLAIADGALVTPQDVDDAIADAVADGTVASQEWVSLHHVTVDEVGSGLTWNEDGGLIVDASAIRAIATSPDTVADLANALDDTFVHVDGGLTHDFLLDAAVRLDASDVDCTEQAHWGTIRYLDDQFSGCTPDGWFVIGGTADGSSPANGGVSCDQILEDNPGSPNGPYWLRGSTAYQVYCDMVTDGGGWTLVMRVSDFDAGVDFTHDGAGWSAEAYGDFAMLSFTSTTSAFDHVSRAYGEVPARDVMVRERLGSDYLHSVRTVDGFLDDSPLRDHLTQSIVVGGRACSTGIVYMGGSPMYDATYDELVLSGDESGDPEPARIAIRTGCSGDTESLEVGYNRSGHGDQEVFSQENGWGNLQSVYVFVR